MCALQHAPVPRGCRHSSSQSLKVNAMLCNVNNKTVSRKYFWSTLNLTSSSSEARMRSLTLMAVSVHSSLSINKHAVIRTFSRNLRGICWIAVICHRRLIAHGQLLQKAKRKHVQTSPPTDLRPFRLTQPQPMHKYIQFGYLPSARETYPIHCKSPHKVQTTPRTTDTS